MEAAVGGVGGWWPPGGAERRGMMAVKTEDPAAQYRKDSETGFSLADRRPARPFTWAGDSGRARNMGRLRREDCGGFLFCRWQKAVRRHEQCVVFSPAKKKINDEESLCFLKGEGMLCAEAGPSARVQDAASRAQAG